MKYLVFFFVLFFSLSFSQDIEDRDDSFILQNNKNLFKIEVLEPFYQVNNRKCLSFEPVKLENGSTDFKNRLEENIYKNIDATLYVINGDFSFVFSVDENGMITNLDILPKVENSEFFFEDMKNMIAENPLKVIPAKCEGHHVSSTLMVKVNINSISTDL